MQCSNCSHENPEGARFCEDCGQPLARACPNCGQPVSPNAKFCGNCGFHLAEAAGPAATPAAVGRLASLQQAAPTALQQKILSARAQIQGERKMVTVLFTDIVGSTALAESLDPEEWGEIVTGAHQCVSEAIYRYEGTIAQLLGDGVLAFFGAPVAHEDDPVRAVLAALDIQKAIDEYARQLATRSRIPNLQMRVGLNTGLVVVGNIGSDLHMEYLAVGDTVNLAARLQSAAEPGTVLISSNTARLVRHAFELESRGELELKGKSEPVPAFRVIGRKAMPTPARGIEGLSSPLVGREREFLILRSRVDELLQGRGQLVAVMGEAGLGKSRLVAELRTALHDQPIVWLEGRSLSYTSSTPYTPFIELFSTFFHVHAEEDDTVKYEKIRARVANLIPKRAEEVAPFIATLLGIKFSGEDFERVRYLQPPQVRERIFQATRDLFEHLAGTRPLILVFEDLHWMDTTSLDLLESLMGLTERAPVMVIVLFRPQRQELSWQFHEIAARDYAHRYTAILLEPLDEAGSRTLVSNLLHIEDLPESVRRLILKKAEGNPFFVEEVIRSLLDTKLVVRENSHWRATREIQDITVPDTLIGVISARLDRLDEASKRVVQTAAVIGREFQFEVLANVYEGQQALDDALLNLQRRELIREKGRMPKLIYLFKHALTRETAYNSILLSKRRELHRRVAECLEQTEPDRVNDIARHFLEAQEEARALPYLLEAGDRAAHAYATQEAISYYRRALEVLRTVEDAGLARRAYEGLGGAQTLIFDVPAAMETYHTMYHYAGQRNDIPMQVSALNKMSFIIGLRLGQFPEAEKHLLEAERLAREVNDLSGLAELYGIRCAVCMTTADFDNAVRYLDESVQIGRQLNLKEQLAFGLAHISDTLTIMTRFDEAWRLGQEAYQIAEEIGNREHLSHLLISTIPFHHLREGDLDAAYRAAEEGTELAAKIGSLYLEAQGAWFLGYIAQMRGEYEQALAYHQHALDTARQSGMPFMVPWTLGALGAAYLEISNRFSSRATEFHAEALQAMQQPAGEALGASVWADMGFCVLASGNLDQADQYFHKGLTWPTMTMYIERPRLLIGAALVALARSRLDEAANAIGEARTFAEECTMEWTYPWIALTDGLVSATRGELKPALESFGRAEELALQMKMRPIVWQARAGAAKVLEALGRTDEANVSRLEARAMVDEIAGLFQDEHLRAMFVESASGRI